MVHRKFQEIAILGRQNMNGRSLARLVTQRNAQCRELMIIDKNQGTAARLIAKEKR
jgi:hypothetical protein